jgi:hypothetical protein
MRSDSSKIGRSDWEMANNDYRMTDKEFASFIETHPHLNLRRSDISDIEEIIMHKILADKALGAQRSEIEFLKNKALDVMGTDHEMKFSDIESGMLRASLSDGRQALKEIIEKTPVEVPSCDDGTKMRDKGRKKKLNDDAGRY